MIVPSKYWVRAAIDARRTIINWPTFFLTEYGLVGTDSIGYRLREGVRILGRSGPDDFMTILAVWNHKAYTPPGFEISDHDTVVDVGAHIGVFSIYAAIRARNGRVYAFEPVPSTCERLRRNVELNGLENVVVSDVAISSGSGKRRLFLSRSRDLAHSFHERLVEGDVGGEIDVRTMSLEDIMDRFRIPQIDFLKINCEGAEYEILFRSSDSTLGRIKKMSVQYHDVGEGCNGECLETFLCRKGFEVGRTPHESYRILCAKKT